MPSHCLKECCHQGTVPSVAECRAKLQAMNSSIKKQHKSNWQAYYAYENNKSLANYKTATISTTTANTTTTGTNYEFQNPTPLVEEIGGIEIGGVDCTTTFVPTTETIETICTPPLLSRETNYHSTMTEKIVELPEAVQNF